MKWIFRWSHWMRLIQWDFICLRVTSVLEAWFIIKRIDIIHAPFVHFKLHNAQHTHTYTHTHTYLVQSSMHAPLAHFHYKVNLFWKFSGNDGKSHQWNINWNKRPITNDNGTGNAKCHRFIFLTTFRPVRFIVLSIYAASSIRDHTINMTHVNRVHNGIYVCEANNGIPPKANATFQIEVHCKYI